MCITFFLVPFEGRWILNFNAQKQSRFKAESIPIGKTVKLIPAFARNISKETRAWVLERNGYTCQMSDLVGTPADSGNIRVSTVLPSYRQ